MNSIEELVLEYVSEETRQAVGSDSMIEEFRQKIEGPSLNLKVSDALTLKRQGHFDKAMLMIAEANRDQVIFIRTIQNLVGQARGAPFPVVVLEKFRQFEPFEIGIADADAVLPILLALDVEPLKDFVSSLHDHEIRKKDEEDYLSFLTERQNDDGESEDYRKAASEILSIDQSLNPIRTAILTEVFGVVGKALEEVPAGVERDLKLLEISRCAHTVITSPILTKPADLVETER